MSYLPSLYVLHFIGIPIDNEMVSLEDGNYLLYV